MSLWTSGDLLEVQRSNTLSDRYKLNPELKNRKKSKKENKKNKNEKTKIKTKKEGK